MKTLIVDDLIENRMVLYGLIKPYGYSDMVVNGKDAVELFESALMEGKSYDLVLLDIMMPVMGGQEALKKMRKIEKDNLITQEEKAVIIMVTAKSSLSDISEAFEDGECNDYIIKPVIREELLERLEAYNLI